MVIRIHLSIKCDKSLKFRWRLRSFTDDVRDAEFFLTWSGTQIFDQDTILIKVSMFVEQIQLNLLKAGYALKDIQFSFTTDCNDILSVINDLHHSSATVEQLLLKIARFNFSSIDNFHYSEFGLDQFDSIVWYDAARQDNGNTKLGICIEQDGKTIVQSAYDCTSKSIMSGELFALQKSMHMLRELQRGNKQFRNPVFVGDNMQLISFLSNDQLIHPNTKLSNVKRNLDKLYGCVRWIPSELNKADVLTR